MRVSSRFRTLFAACALTASLAACADAPSPTASDASTPRQGRMLQPGQASKVKPGDFIVYRPEEYEKFGISTFTGPSGIRSAASRPPVDEFCYLTLDGYDSCDPCYDDYGNYTCGGDPCYDYYGNPTYSYGCTYNPEPVCYDAYGNKTYNSGCTYPEPVCYDAYGNKTYQAGCVYPTPPPTGPATQQSYGSSAPYDGWINTGGVLLKQVRLISFSQSIANVASFTVDAVFKNVGAGSGYGCNNTAEAFDYASAYATGTGYLEVSRVAQWNGTIKFQVDGTHTFNPVSGATGGGTFYTSSNYCG